MATATKKKASRGTGSKGSKKKAPTRKAPSKKAAGAKKKPVAKLAAKGQTQKAPAGKAPATKSSAAKAAKKPNEPERSSPAMAEVDAEVLEFIAAIDDFKQRNGRPFPSWSEVLLIVRQLGYRRA